MPLYCPAPQAPCLRSVFLEHVQFQQAIAGTKPQTLFSRPYPQPPTRVFNRLPDQPNHIPHLHRAQSTSHHQPSHHQCRLLITTTTTNHLGHCLLSPSTAPPQQKELPITTRESGAPTCPRAHTQSVLSVFQAAAHVTLITRTGKNLAKKHKSRAATCQHRNIATTKTVENPAACSAARFFGHIPSPSAP